MPAKSKVPPIKVMVSSSVYYQRTFLKQVFGALTQFGYRVLMSDASTVFVDSDKSNYDNCIAAVKECDAFLGIITGHYGTGEVPGEGVSITHLEMRHAIELNKPRWFLVHKDVTLARTLLNQFRFRKDGTKRNLKFRETAVLDDIRVLDLYDEVIQVHVPPDQRKGNWAQEFYEETDAMRYIHTQFGDPERIREHLR
jgi:hypothetical protein